MNNRIIAALLLTVSCAFGAEEPVKFSTKPTVTRVSDKVKIDFAASKETDAAVYILNAQDKAVRHLVAGSLGKNAPEPFKSSLSQSVEWDGKDDFGKPATGGPFKVRVALGLKPEFDSFVMNNPDGLGRVHALAVGPGGSLYVFHVENTANDNMGGHKIKILTRDGKHQKVLVPFAADISPDRIKALAPFQTKEGDLIPHTHSISRTFYKLERSGRRPLRAPSQHLDAGEVHTRSTFRW